VRDTSRAIVNADQFNVRHAHEILAFIRSDWGRYELGAYKARGLDSFPDSGCRLADTFWDGALWHLGVCGWRGNLVRIGHWNRYRKVEFTEQGDRHIRRGENAEPINGSDPFVRHACCGAAGAPSLGRINSTLELCTFMFAPLISEIMTLGVILVVLGVILTFLRVGEVGYERKYGTRRARGILYWKFLQFAFLCAVGCFCCAFALRILGRMGHR
jgi:hypothetical protein